MEAKNILILSTGDSNGAYEAMYKVSKILIGLGHNVKMVVKEKLKEDNFIIKYGPNSKSLYNKVFDKIKGKFFKSKNTYKGDKNYFYISADEQKKNIDIDKLINLVGFIPDFTFVGMTSYFMNSTDLANLYEKTNTAIYNITVDMNHFTGGCHFAWDCKKHETSCDNSCPALLENKGLAEINFNEKLKNAKKSNFKIIAGSGWTLMQAKNSAIYAHQKNIYNINSVIDTKLLNAKNRNIAKQVFGLNKDKKYILCGSQNITDIRKGYNYFLEALKILERELSPEEIKNTEILVVSRDSPNLLKELKFNIKNIEYIKDYRLLSLLYQSVDVFVNCSIEDSGPMMVSEALACGTPVVGFDMGVVNNMVVSDFNGYKSILKDSSDLAYGIKKILNLSKDEYTEYSKNAVVKVEEESSFEYASEVFRTIIETNCN